MVALGAVAERAHLGPLVVFVFVWSTFVYSPIARWTWNPKGWSARLGVLDYAGGTPVHITSGATALALSFYLGVRSNINLRGVNYPPNNVGYICLGTSLIWFGWFGFNGGSALGANFQAAEALIVTNIAACTGGLTFLLLVCLFYKMQGAHPNDEYRIIGTITFGQLHPFAPGLSTGLLPLPLLPVMWGLVRIIILLPWYSFVDRIIAASLLFGIISAIACKYSYGITRVLNIDDALQVGIQVY